MLNQIHIIGRLGKNAELQHTSNGNPNLKLSVATSQQWKDKAGQKQEKTQWFNVVLWGNFATALGGMLEKGMLVYVGGRMESRDYQDKNGQKAYFWEIVASDLKILGGGKYRDTGKGASDAGHGGGSGQGSYEEGGPETGHGGTSSADSTDFEDDIPF
jgi:single-strand DNA-binding protein